MRKFYRNVNDFQVYFTKKFLIGDSIVSSLYIHIFYNSICISAIILGYYGPISPKALIICGSCSLILWILNKIGLGWALQVPFNFWLFNIGLRVKDNAYINLTYTSKKSAKFWTKIFNSDIISRQILIKYKPEVSESKTYKNEIKILEEEIKSLSVKKPSNISLLATYFAYRRPITFFDKQEYANA
tara:strand:+ start:76 stop:633 length:558 start_codon:yes stop_codon:yes gene_type:complete